MAQDEREDSERIRLVKFAEGNGESGGESFGALERVLSAPGAVARRLARSEAIEGVQVLARGGQPLPVQPMEGDVLIRIIEGGSGHASVVASRGVRPTARGEGMVHVVERFPIARNAAEGFNRRATDTAGRLLEDLVLLRLAMPTPTTPTVVAVQPTPAMPVSDQPVRVAIDPSLTVIPTPTEAGPDEPACDHIDSSRLSWSGASQQQLDMMRAVYIRQVSAACQSRNFIADVSASEVAEIENGVSARREAASSCQTLLTAARAALAADSVSSQVTGIGVLSGYRSASHQLANWNRNFPRYFRETQADRAGSIGGPYGDAAVALLTRHISRRLAAPGFSLHNDGRAIDFFTSEGGRTFGADTSPGSRTGWRRTWFFRWLSANANGYGFFQNTAIDEPWHWEFRRVAAPTQSDESILVPDTVEPEDIGERLAAETTVAAGRAEFSNTPLLSSHRGTQPDLILRWNDMTDPTAVDVVVHLHGYSSDKENMRLRNKEAYSGLDFADPSNAAITGRSAATLGILPRGSYTGDAPGANRERYTFPALVTANGITDLISYGLTQFASAAGIGGSVSRNRLIVTAHSGGGAALMRALGNNNPNEIYAFDALYSDASPLISWANARIAAEIQAWTPGKTRADGAMCVIFRPSGTGTQSLRVHRAIRSAIAGAPADAQPVLRASYRVVRTAVAHGEIPRRFGWRLLTDPTQPLSATAAAESEAAEDTEAHSVAESLAAEGLAEGLEEALGPEGATVETFSNVESVDIEEWIKLKLVRDATGAETEISSSSSFTATEKANLDGIHATRPVSKPAPGEPDYEVKWKARVYYPRGAKEKQLAGKRRFPLALIIHGHHGWIDGGVEIENHLGYEYLQKDLAARGIVSASISTNPANAINSMTRSRADLILAGLRILGKLNGDPKSRFHNRLDFQNAGLMGHSRGGDGVVRAAIMNRTNADISIRAVCSLAPTDFTGTNPPASRLSLLDTDHLHYLVVYGTHDGDVGGQDAGTGSGFRHYDRATCARTIVFIKNAKHDRFNTNWNNQPDYSDPLDCNSKDPGLADTEHRQLAIDYIGGLFRSVLNREPAVSGLLDGSKADSGSHTVSIQWSPPRAPRILTAVLYGTAIDPSTKWSKGWTTLMPVELPGQDRQFELAYKEATGDVTIDRLDTATGSDTLWSGQWRKGWTHFVPFHMPGDDQQYDLAYMGATGEAAIDRIWRDGKGVDVNIWKAKWTLGWTSFMPFRLPADDRAYILSYKAGSGDVSFDRILQIGNGTESVYSATWGKGWTSFMPFRLPGDDRQHYLAYKKESGEVTMDRINANGAGVVTIWHDTWGKGWTSFLPFHVPGDNRTYYLAYKEGEGKVTVDRIRRDGMGIDTILEEQWTKNWTNFLTIELAGKPYFLAYKSGAGDMCIGRLLPDQMLQIDDFEGSDLAKDSLGGAAALTSASRLLFEPGIAPTPLPIPHETTVLTGTTASAKYTAEIPEPNRDLTGFDAVTFRLANKFDVTSEASISAGAFIDFKIRILSQAAASGTTAVGEATHNDIDTAGVRGRVRPVWRRLFVPTPLGWKCGNGTKTPMQTLSIPLTKFGGVNWRDVRSIEFVAGPSVATAFYLDSLAFVQS